MGAGLINRERGEFIHNSVGLLQVQTSPQKSPAKSPKHQQRNQRGQ